MSEDNMVSLNPDELMSFHMEKDFVLQKQSVVGTNLNRAIAVCDWVGQKWTSDLPMYFRKIAEWLR